MAETINFFSYDNLTQYHGLLTTYVDEAIASGIETSFKGVSLTEDGKLQFWTELPFEGVEELQPAYEIVLPKEDLTSFMKLVEGAVEGNVASFGTDGQVVDIGIKIADLATKTEVSAVQEAVDALSEKVGEVPDGQTVIGIIKNIQENAYDDTELKGSINSNTDAITVLNGDENTEGSVANAIADNEIFETDILTVNALGGIAANTDLNGLTTHEILNKLLYPYVAQVVGNPTRTPNTTVLENGNNQTITAVTVSVTKKSEVITSVALYNGSTLLAEKTGDEVAAGGTFTFSGLSVEVPSTNVVLTVKVTDTSGNVVSKNTAGWNFVYPYYVGVCTEDATIDKTLVEGLTKKIETKGNKSISYTCDNQRCVFAYPKAHGTLKSILDPNSFESLGSFTQYEVSVTGLDGEAQVYYVYVNGASTVTDFIFTFKY